MNDVVLLSLADDQGDGGCGACGDSCGSAATPRVPVLACRDALVAGGATVDLVTACSDKEIDAALDRLPAPGTAGAGGSGPALVVASASDGQLRAVLRRLVRRYAPPPSGRPDGLPANRTVPDLPPVGVLPLDPRSATPGEADLAAQLGLPREPAAVAAAVLGGRTRRLDLLRHDGGSVTLHGALLRTPGGAFHALVEVDDVVLSDGTEPLLGVAVSNAGGYAVLDDGLPLTVDDDPADGVLDVAVAVPVVTRRLFRADQVRVEVRRARGRAASVNPREDVSYLDDGVRGTLTRKRSWWMEHGAWAAYVS